MRWFNPFKRPSQAQPVQLEEEEAAKWFSPSSPQLAAKNAHLPRFRGNARDQIQPSERSKADLAHMRFRSAFTPGQPVMRADRFAGRSDVLVRLIEAVEDQRLHAVLYGERGIGKTSLLHVLAGSAREAGYLVLYQSCDAETQFDEMFRSVLACIPQLYHTGVAPSDEDAAAASLLEMAPAGELSARHAADLLAQVAGVRVLFLLDEFDRALSPAFRRSTAELIKNLSDRCARVQILIAGVAGDYSELIEHIPSIRRNILPLLLPRMSDAEIEQLLAMGTQEGGVGFSTTARLRIRTIARGSPYVAALLAHHGGLACIGEGAQEVSVAHVMTAIEKVADELSGSDAAERALALAG